MKPSYLKPVFDVLENAFSVLGINYYLIGAIARQVWYDRGGISIRTTADVDYAVLVGSHDEYYRMKRYLIESEGFIESKGNAFALITKDGVVVDMLPFGEIENDGQVSIHGAGMSSIRVDGMREVYEAGTEELILDTGNNFLVATLPGIVLLKFIAYDDRPEVRQKDAFDIAHIIKHFFNLNEDLIYESHNDLFEKEERSLESIGSIVLGREISKITAGNLQLIERIAVIVKKHIELNADSPLVRLMVNANESNVEEITFRLKDILDGLQTDS